MTYTTRLARQNRAPGPTSPELATRITEHGDAVPFLVPLASWNPVERDLREWLADQLVLAHTALADTEPGGKGSTIAQALLASGLIFPVLDGLDEIPRSARGMAISRLNEALMPGQPIVVTCRTEDYRDAVRPPDGEEVSLRAAAAIQLAPLSVDVVAKYLLSDAGGPNARARWRPVIEAMEKAMPVAQALTTPLMAGLARVIYNPRPGEKLGDLDDPAELCKPVLGDRTAVEAHLFDGFIPAAYRGESPWTAEQAEPWLMFLAHHLQDTVDGTDLAWWQLIEGKQSEHHSRPARSLRFRPILVVNSVLLGAMTGVLTYATAHLLPTGYGAGYQAAYLVAGGARMRGWISFVGFLTFLGLAAGLVAGLTTVGEDLANAARSSVSPGPRPQNRADHGCGRCGDRHPGPDNSGVGRDVARDARFRLQWAGKPAELDLWRTSRFAGRVHL